MVHEPLARMATIFTEQRAVEADEAQLMQELGVSARLLRGIAGSADFERLTEQAYWQRRPFVMMLDADGITELVATATSLTATDRRDFGLQLARAAGWPDDFTRELLATPGMCFKVALVIGGELLAPASWPNVLAAMKRHLGSCNERVSAALDSARPELEAAAARGQTLGDLLGPGASKISQADFEASALTTTDVLRYTMECIGANALFTGDGYTRTVDGRRGPRELLAPNLPLAAFPRVLLVALEIASP